MGKCFKLGREREWEVESDLESEEESEEEREYESNSESDTSPESSLADTEPIIWATDDEEDPLLTGPNWNIRAALQCTGYPRRRPMKSLRN